MYEPGDGQSDGLTDDEMLALHARFLRATARKKKVKPPVPSSAFAPQLSEDDARQQENLFRALADDTRLRILDVLNRHGGDVCVFELVACFSLEQPTISHHLRILRAAGLVDYRKRGLYAYYHVRREGFYRACNALEQFTDPSNK